MNRTKLSERLADLHAGRRSWLAEFGLRGAGLLFLAGFWRLAQLAHHMATTPSPHPAGIADLAVCAGVVFLFCGGLMLTFVGPGLFLDIPLPPHFTRPSDFNG
jgi:hypothetical protein